MNDVDGCQVPLIDPIQSNEDQIIRICPDDETTFEIDIFAWPEANGLSVPLSSTDEELRYQFFRYDVDA